MPRSKVGHVAIGRIDEPEIGRTAYLDESDMTPRAGQTGSYLIAAAIVEMNEYPLLGELLRNLLRPEDTDLKGHSRLHMSRIADKQRKSNLLALMACLRGVEFSVGWLSGYMDAKERERARGQVLWEFLPYLATKDNAEKIIIEQRGDAKLRALDARTVGRLRDHGLLASSTVVEQIPASQEPGLWLADAAASAWRRRLFEGKDNWSRWYISHTVLHEIAYRKGEGRT